MKGRYTRILSSTSSASPLAGSWAEDPIQTVPESPEAFAPFPEDLALVRAALGENEDALERLVERLGCIPAIVRARQRRSGFQLGPNRLDDVVQDVLTAVWRRLRSFEGRSSLETWLYGFCVNVLRKAHQRSGLPLERLEREEDLPSVPADGSEGLVTESAHERIHACLDRLGPPASDVIRLKNFEDLTFDELAQRLGMSANTAKSHYYRGLRRLHVWLRDVWREETA